MRKAISIFTNSAGALLIALATALFLINWTSPADYVPLHDPLFLIPLNEVFWIIGGIALVIALICFFSERLILSVFLLVLLVTISLVCRIGLFLEGFHSLTGFLGGFTYTFEISANIANALANTVFAYLLIGGCVAAYAARRLPPAVEFHKMACPFCGVRVKFPVENLGKKTDCTSCKANITLRKSEEMSKMTCFFCQDHVEFPAHALGRKIKCPYCKMDIGLKEETV